jgi:hypothetical protein
VKARRCGVLALVAVAAAALPARAQTDPGVPEISVEGGKAQPAQPVQPLPPQPEPPPAPPPPSRADTALERVLRSGCRDGLEEVGALRGDPSAPWADTVTRLCGNVLRHPGPAGGPAETISESASANEGRGRLALWSSLYGIWLGIASDIMIKVNSPQAAVLQPMLGLGLGLALSLGITSQHPVTTGQAWTIITGLDYASINGALWGGGLGLSAQGVAGMSILTSAVAAPVAIFVATTQRPKAGDIELVRSSLLWGTVAGLLGAASLSSGTTAENGWRTGAIAMDVSLGAGIALANSFDLSRNRVLIIDSGAVGGGLVGLGVAVLVQGNKVTGRAAAGGALAGLVAGIAIAALATHNLDTPEAQTQASAPAYPALFARAADGRWSLGMPAPTPVFDGTGGRAVGASMAALGGLF